MKIDCRLPLLVVTGTWNRAIFQPGWIAFNLLGVPEGENIEIMQVVDIQSPQRQITYIGDIGIAASNSRVEIFANSHEPETLSRAENACCALIEKLPHTPFGAYGVNFYFVEPDPSPNIVDLLKSNEEIDRFYKIKTQEFFTSLAMGDAVELNFRRQISSAGVTFNFNFNHPSIGPKNYKVVVLGSVDRSLRDCKELMKRLYKIEEYGTIRHEADVTKKAQGA